MTEALNLPVCNLRIRESKGKKYAFDEVRKKYVLLTPEEWVRQHIIHFLINYKKYPGGLLMLEKSFLQNRVSRRCDIIVCNREGESLLLVECKAPSVAITQQVFDQAAAYNLEIKASVIAITNGINHYCFKLESE